MFSSLSKCKIIIYTDVLKIALPLGFSLEEGRRGHCHVSLLGILAWTFKQKIEYAPL